MCFLYWLSMVDVCKRSHSKILVKKQPEGCFLWDKVQHATGESALQIIIHYTPYT